ncbi:LAME_0A00144g1_1 [Lachancea meyersii CBS 8951]|uniref:LAME_0A00144g1_1 n=1 Tax=Lachancea meyersii CBS 8951 TaxID=1266667 RepID=A0A1G4ILG1_9SACH|nr:LAME_0A00144g1_1 [Lachancea meyersii CBS 8951]
MTVGTLYAWTNARGMLPRGLVEWLKIDMDVANPSDNVEEFKKLFPLGKNPAFLGKDGFELTEVIAIVYYLVSLKGDAELERSLYGETLEERSQVLRLLSFTNSELAPSVAAIVMAARTNASAETYNGKLSQCLATFGLLEKYLSQHEFLVKDQITIADLFAASMCGTVFGFALGKDKFGGLTKLQQWLPKVIEHPALKGRLDPANFKEKTIVANPE